MSPLTGPPPPSQQYWQDRRWIHDNYPALVRAHANEWIAVSNRNVLVSGEDLDQVEMRAHAACSAPDIVFQFIDDGSLIF